ncbi:MAG: hypothetical protein WCV90_08980 [Candidatus Woesearchaeota archaeon]|jgi:hypothetical protein
MNQKFSEFLESLVLILIGASLALIVCLSLNYYNITPFSQPEREDCSSLYDGCWAQVQGGKGGDWISINIEGMSFERAYEVCRHEVGHEIFAEVCEKNMTKCLEVE